MTDEEIWHLNYSIQFNTRALEDDRELLKLAQEQLKRHHQELNIRKKAACARQSIDYLEKHFIPDTEERLESIKRHIEIRKLQLTGLSYEEAESQMDLADQQLELFG